MLKKLELTSFHENVFELIGKKWLLLGAESNDVMNAMTASWGGLGVIWNKNVATVYIRPQRFTKHLFDESDTFSIMVFTEEYRDALKYMGTTSGKDEDKTKHCEFHIQHIDDTPYYEEAAMVITCRKLYAQPLAPEHFVDASIDEKNYPLKDYHTMYIGEIINVYKKADDI